ncbi:uncharacterized protein LOC110263868 [Arachis ipaensis]|uniref:uncharacterized protein LOC110263868 n=1 Tax=Arachis ipaensis TaxID=130454 RepID=UPI000A2B8C61|nr:uncharacterized protein LOC110263868 [Arachis ipaensis]
MKTGSLFHYLLLITTVASAAGDANRTCAPSSCGKVTNISHPFRLKDDPQNCGDERYELACENNIAVLALFPGKNYHVESINYNNFTIRLVDPGISEDDCSTLPHYSITGSYLWNNEDESRPYEGSQDRQTDFRNGSTRVETVELFYNVVFLECRNPVRDDPRYVDTASCIKQGHHVYAVVGGLTVVELRDGCHVKLVAAYSSSFLAPPSWPYQLSCNQNYSYAEIHRMLSYGFELSWVPGACQYKCGLKRSYCAIDQTAQSSLICLRDSCYTPLFGKECRKNL